MAQISYGTITITDTNDVESIIIEYAKNSSSVIPPDSQSNDWSTIRPTWEEGKFIWQRTRIHKAGTPASSDTFSAAVCLSGSSGATGRSLLNTETKFTHAIQNATKEWVIQTTGDNWLDDVPEYDEDYPDYWVRIKNTFSSAPLEEFIYYKDSGITDAMATAAEANETASTASTNANAALQQANQTNTSLTTYISANDIEVNALKTKTKKIIQDNNGITVVASITGNKDDIIDNDVSTYGFNTNLTTSGINLRYNGIKYTNLSTGALIFYYPKMNDETPIQGESALRINSEGLKIYEKYTGTGNPETTANLNARLAVELTTSGLVIKKGSIIIGTKTDNTTGYVTLSDTDFTRTINSTSRSNLRMAIGSNFGVKNDGTLYASNAVISGQITVNDNSNVYTKDQSYTKDQVTTLAGWSVRINVTAISYVSNTATLEAILYYKGNEATSTDLSGATYAYQWYKNTTAISGATGATLSVTNTSALGLNGIYTCKVNVTKHSVSNTASNSVDLMSLQAAGEPNKYITRISDSGIKIHPQNNATTNYVQIDGDGMYIYKNGVEQAHFKNDILIGATSQIGHIRIDSTYGIRFLRGDDNTRMAQLASDGLQIWNYNSSTNTNTSIAFFGTTARIGAHGSSRFLMNADSLQAYDSDGNQYFQVDASGITYGSNIHVADQTDVDNLQNWQDNFAIGGRNLLTKTGTPATLTTIADRSWFNVPSYRVTDYGGIELANTNNVNITYSFDYSITGVDTAFNLTASLATAQGNYSGGVVVAQIPTGSSSGHAQGSRNIPSGMRTYAVGQGILFSGSGNSNADAVLTVSNVKVEIGNQATSWTPAPEDVEDSISNNSVYKYITKIDSDGIFVAPESQTPTIGAPGNSVRINGSGLYVYQGGVERAYFTGTAAAIGTYGKGRAVIQDSGLSIYNYVNSTQKLIASFGATAQVGMNDSSRFLMNADSLQAYNSSNKLYFQISSSGIKYGTDLSSSSTTSTVANTANVSAAETAAKTYAKNQADDAATKATNYLDFSDSYGLNIRYKYSTGWSNQRVNIQSDAIRIYDRRDRLAAFFGVSASNNVDYTYIQLGSNNDNNYLKMNSSGLDIMNKETNDNSFSSSAYFGLDGGKAIARLGKMAADTIYTYVDSSGFYVRERNSTNTSYVSLAEFRTYIVLGKVAANLIYTYIDSDELCIRQRNSTNNGFTNLAQFGATTQIGSTRNVTITSSEVSMNNGSTKYVSITSNGMKITNLMQIDSNGSSKIRFLSGTTNAYADIFAATYEKPDSSDTSTLTYNIYYDAAKGAHAFYCGDQRDLSHPWYRPFSDVSGTSTARTTAAMYINDHNTGGITANVTIRANYPIYARAWRGSRWVTARDCAAIVRNTNNTNDGGSYYPFLSFQTSGTTPDGTPTAGGDWSIGDYLGRMYFSRVSWNNYDGYNNATTDTERNTYNVHNYCYIDIDGRFYAEGGVNTSGNIVGEGTLTLSKSIYLPHQYGIFIKNKAGNNRSIISFESSNDGGDNNIYIGWGTYNNSEGALKLYGNDLTLRSKGAVTITAPSGITLSGNTTVINSLFYIRAVPFSTGNISPNGYITTASKTLASVSGYVPVGIIGWSSTNHYVSPFTAYIQNSNTLSVGYHNSNPSDQVSATVTFRIMYMKANGSYEQS